MKNFKKVLCLVLCVAMLASFVVVASAKKTEDYTDASAVASDRVQAIDVLSTLGILNGDAQGNMNPTGTLTRAEAAKMIAVLKNAGNDIAELYASACTFTDMASAEWAKSYVAYCASTGIVAGVGDNKFNPQGTLTGTQFCKMLLVCLEYDASIEGYTGANWATNVLADAKDADLLEDMASTWNAGAALTREDAAQLMLNALKAIVVTYENKGATITIDGTQITTGASTAKKDGGFLYVKLYDNDLKLTADTTDDFGRTADTWRYKNSKIGTYAETPDVTYTGKVTRDTMYEFVGKDCVNDILNGDNADATLTVVVDGTVITNKNKGDTEARDTVIGYYFQDNSSLSIGGAVSGTPLDYTGNGTTTEVYYDTDNNAVKIVIMHSYVAQAQSDYKAKKNEVTLSILGDPSATYCTDANVTVSGDDYDLTNVKADDYFIVTLAGTNVAAKDVKSLAAATVVSGKVDTYKAGDNVTVDGTKYEYALTAETDADNGKTVKYSIGEEANVVTDGTYIYYVDEAVVASDKYVFVKAIGDADFGATNMKADVVFADGTAKVIVIKDEQGDEAKTAIVAANEENAWYTYTVNSKDVYTLTKVTEDDTPEKDEQYSVTTDNEDGTKLTESGKTYLGVTNKISDGAVTKVNGATVFVIDDGDDIKVYTGAANVPTLAVDDNAALTAYYTMKDATYAKYVFIDADGADIDEVNTSTSDFIFVLKLAGTDTDKNDNTCFEVEALVNGELKTDLIFSDDFTGNEIEAMIGNLYTDVKQNSDGYYTKMNEVDRDDDYAAIPMEDSSVSFSNSVIEVDGETAVTTSDCKVYLVAMDTNIKEDNGADYYFDGGLNVKGVVNTLDDYNELLDGTIFAHENDDGLIDTMYFFVWDTTDATPV